MNLLRGKKKKIRSRRRVFFFRAVLLLSLAVTFFCLHLLQRAWVPLGKAPSGEILRRMQSSEHYNDGVFVNTQPMYNDVWGMMSGWTERSDFAVPTEPLPVAQDTLARLEEWKKLAEPEQELRVTWLGHSSTVIEIGGLRVLTDPVFGPTASPFDDLGPSRWYEPPVALEALRGVDIVLISHDHYDHLDQPTISRMKDWDTTFIVPLGVASHLIYWGIEKERIVSLHWWEEFEEGALRIVATPSRHASGRQLFDQMRTHWAGYALIAPTKRAFYSGDTGFFDELTVIAERFAPFDLVMVEVGAYNAAWPDWHMGPEQAVLAHQLLRGRYFLPIHWGLFDLALHGWTEPAERVVLAAQKAKINYLTPRPGQLIDLENPPSPEPWWPKLPFKTAKESPVVATKNGDPKERYKH